MSATRASEKNSKHKAVSNGAAQLSELAEKKLVANLETIAEAVLKGALKGTASSVMLLVNIAMGAARVKEAEVVRSGESLAMSLAAAPEWSEAASEETGESAGGSREPEA
jgi:hypothetical protein